MHYMPECVFALIQLNLINDRKEMGERERPYREGGGSNVSEAENMVRAVR